jgi:virulence factor Mce-like protein
MRRNHRQRVSYFQAGVIAIVLIGIVTFFGFTKSVPFRHHYTVKAVFRNANDVKPGSPVRVAGVNVGKVTEVKPVAGDSPAAEVSMRMDKKGLPLHRDATFKVRPRIFLEGNFFVDVQPGSPNAPTTGDGHVFPVQQTNAPVQIDQVTTALQSATRKDLQKLLRELSSGLQGDGAGGYNRSIRYWAPAYKGSALVADASLGRAEHDLSNLIKSSGVVAQSLDRQPRQLQSLIADLNTTVHALGVHDGRLQAAIAELPRTLSAGLPALRSLNASFPSVRRFVVAMRPAVRSTGPAINASLPLFGQLRGLVSRSELRGLVGDLRPTVPSLARLNRSTVPLYEQVRAASSCQNQVILPWSHDKIEDPTFPAPGPVYQEALKPMPGLAGESRSGDANGQWFRVLADAGQYAYPTGDGNFTLTGQPIEGTNPPMYAKRPPLKPDVPCETQQQPDLRTNPGAPPAGFKVQQPSTPEALARYAKAQATAIEWLRKQIKTQGLSDELKVSDQPLTTDRLDAIKSTLGTLGHFATGGAAR